METLYEYAGFIHLFSVISFLMLLLAASQFSHSDPIVRTLLSITGLSIIYSTYHLFTLKEDNPYAVELEVFKKVGIFTLVCGSISIALIVMEN